MGSGFSERLRRRGEAATGALDRFDMLREGISDLLSSIVTPADRERDRAMFEKINKYLEDPELDAAGLRAKAAMIDVYAKMRKPYFDAPVAVIARMQELLQTVIDEDKAIRPKANPRGPRILEMERKLADAGS